MKTVTPLLVAALSSLEYVQAAGVYIKQREVEDLDDEISGFEIPLGLD